MGKAKDLTEAEKCIIVKEMAKGTQPKVIATSIGLHVDTVKRYLSNPSPRKTLADAGVPKSVTDRVHRNIKWHLFKNPGRKSKTILEQANLPEVSKSTRCRLLRGVTKNLTPQKTTSPNTTTQGIAVRMG